MKERICFVLICVYFASPSQLFASNLKLTGSQQEQLAEAVKARLKDPFSAVFSWDNIDDYANADDVLIEYCFSVNGKNAFGEYVGFRQVWSEFSLQGRVLSKLSILGIGGDRVDSSCSEIRRRTFKNRNHDPRITYDQAKAGCYFSTSGELLCASPGTGMCWERNHNPTKGEAPARAVDAVAEPEKCG